MRKFIAMKNHKWQWNGICTLKITDIKNLQKDYNKGLVTTQAEREKKNIYLILQSSTNLLSRTVTHCKRETVDNNSKIIITEVICRTSHFMTPYNFDKFLGFDDLEMMLSDN